MTDDELALRRLTYGLVADLGRPPTSAEVADRLGSDVAAVRDGWRRLHDAHALVLDQARDEILMANPFSAVPTSFRVRADGRSWHANCAWDAFGICAALDVDGEIETSCPDCGAAICVDVCDRRASDETLLFHCLVPASSWWDDIVFT